MRDPAGAAALGASEERVHPALRGARGDDGGPDAGPGLARIVGEHDTRLWRIVKHYVDEARAAADHGEVRAVGVDEKACRRGHGYVTFFADLGKRGLPYAIVGRKWGVLGEFRADLEARRGSGDGIRELCMDMSAAGREGAPHRTEEASGAEAEPLPQRCTRRCWTKASTCVRSVRCTGFSAKTGRCESAGRSGAIRTIRSPRSCGVDRHLRRRRPGLFRASPRCGTEQFSMFVTLIGTNRWIPRVQRHLFHLAYERSKKMKNRIGTLLVLIAAGLMTSGASAVVAADGPKQKFCNSIGCPDETELECFKGKVGLQVGPVVIEGTVTCYEPLRQS